MSGHTDLMRMLMSLGGLSGFPDLIRALRERDDCHLIFIVDSGNKAEARAEMLVSEVSESLIQAIAECEAKQRARVIADLSKLIAELKKGALGAESE